MVVGGFVSNRLKNKFKKYSKIATSSGLSGKEIAQKMLEDHNINNVRIISVAGKLTDHYNPMDKTVNLSPDVYAGRSVMAAAVAAHECGHAVQHATAYAPLKMRSTLVPLQALSGKILNILFFVMIFGVGASFLPYEMAGILIVGVYSVFTLFAFITLPVEYDATKRALAWVDQRNITQGEEHDMATDALNAAAKTYLVAALGSLAMLLFYAMSFLGND